MRSELFLVLFVIASCSAAPAPSEPDLIGAPPIPTGDSVNVVPNQLRAALDRAEPREHALAASPHSDGDDIAMVRLLHHNVVLALNDLERSGRHATPEQIQRAQTAMKDLQNHLNEFAATHKGQ